MDESVEVFDRAAVGDILDLDYAVVKNWSTGKPLLIEPSIYAPHRRGAQSLYSRKDLYRFALAKYWSVLGFSLDAISRVLTRIKAECPECFEPQTRGTLVVAKLGTAKPIVKHIRAGLSENEFNIEVAQVLMPGMFGSDLYGIYLSRVGEICEWVDKQIEKHKKQAAKRRNEQARGMAFTNALARTGLAGRTRVVSAAANGRTRSRAHKPRISERRN